MSSVRIDPNALDGKVREIKKLKEEYAEATKKLYTANEKLKSAWKGQDSDAMQAKVTEAEATIKGLEQVIDGIGNGLDSVRKTYDAYIEEMKNRGNAL